MATLSSEHKSKSYQIFLKMQSLAAFTKILQNLCTYQCQTGRGGGGKAGHRGGFGHFSNIAVKFPTPGQKCEVKYNCCHGNGIKGVFVFLL